MALLPRFGGFGKSGVPDIIGCLNGKLIGIECKATPKDKPTALQLKQLKAIHEHGGVALVVNCESVEGLEEELMKRCEWDMYCGERTKNAAGDARF